MFITKSSVSRRTVLRGIGATLSLPLLDAMVPALTRTALTAATPTKRFGAIFVPMGERPSHWTPAAINNCNRYDGRVCTTLPSPCIPADVFISLVAFYGVAFVLPKPPSRLTALE